MSETNRDAPRRATRADVARYAGVSPAVVSYTLNPGTGPVAPATRARVEDAVRALGYRPNAAARTLKGASTKMLGVVVPDSANPFFAQLGHAIDEAAAERGYALIVVNVDGPPESIAPAIRNLAFRQVDGMLIATGLSLGALAAITESGTPAVLLNQLGPVEELPAVGPDLYRAAREGTEHLLAHGHERIAFIGGAGPNDQRLHGWRDALAAARRPPDRIAAVPYTREAGYAAGKQLLAGPRRPTAVFVSSDMQAVGALRAFHEAAVDVPNEMAIVSFDGSPESEYSWPALTTLRQPVRDMARDALERLLDPLAERSLVPYRCSLIVRRSCGCGPPLDQSS